MTIGPDVIQKTIQDRYPTLTVAFNGPASATEIADAERKLGVEFPEDFKQFYLAANGQQLDERGCGTGVPCIPRLPFGGESSETCTWGEFLSLDGIVLATLAHRELQEVDDYFSEFEDDNELIGPVTVHRSHVIFCDPGTGDCIGLDLSPADGGQRYQVVAINHEGPDLACLADSFSQFLALVVDQISSSEVVYSEEEECFVPAAEA
ncbi:SMI1/KNR4 family protein [Blastopirellula marina]|uniref:Knr4/Smi1-like domain-containing protein n=1 Tax=Blastopirellula marina TaxID=124 RepID=A0A2S8GJ31_9BACT|nr:SMI1/KNR4 family protein [Blastopirellula marina]PQO44426.1 hypothetical protein C5Y93_18595 [Blastopirellula marina]